MVAVDPTVTLNESAAEKYRAKYKNDGIMEERILKRWTTAWQEAPLEEALNSGDETFFVRKERACPPAVITSAKLTAAAHGGETVHVVGRVSLPTYSTYPTTCCIATARWSGRKTLLVATRQSEKIWVK